MLLYGASQVVEVKISTCQCKKQKRCKFDPWSRRSYGEGNTATFSILAWKIQLQYSCLENSMDRAAWQARSHWGLKGSDVTEPVCAYTRAHTHTPTTYTHSANCLRWQKSHLRCPFVWISEMSAGLVLIILVFTMLHQDLTIFLPGELSHLLQVNVRKQQLELDMEQQTGSK